MSILSEKQVEQQLSKLHDWALEGRAIRKQFTFKDFPDAVAFVNRLVPDAQAADHHPDIDIRYNKVRLIVSTHSKGGLTELDFGLAERIDTLAE